MQRESVPVEEALKDEVRTHPERFGLPAELSMAQRFARLLQLGAKMARQRQQDEARYQAYAEWADDEERLEAVRMAQAVAFRSGRL
ncbi:MAG: hypothetical protein HY690_12455 [Chloroflexi bacterium]|nr:hypothetical protein [Chloroflexota bacterium]